VASVAAFVRSPGSISYSATKSWMARFHGRIVPGAAKCGIKVLVQALCPGFTYSEFHDTMGVDRKRLAGSQFWMSAEDVVDASIAGLRRGKLFVIPGWRYRLLSSVLTKLPSAIRLKIEMAGGRARTSAWEWASLRLRYKTPTYDRRPQLPLGLPLSVARCRATDWSFEQGFVT
jgi:short-subunit dehydrogenase